MKRISIPWWSALTPTRFGRSTVWRAARPAAWGQAAPPWTLLLCGAFAATVLLLAGCQTARAHTDYVPTWPRFYLESGDAEATTVTLPKSGTRTAINSKPVIAENDVADVVLAKVELGPCLLFRLTPAAARDLYRMTAANQGRRLVLTLNNVAIGARRIDAPISDGDLLIFVELPDTELPMLVNNLKRSSIDLQREMAKR